MGAGQGSEQAQRLREHPQTAALGKPVHFAVTRLGLTSGPGGSVTRSVRRLVGHARSGLGCRRPPFCLALPLLPPTSATQIMGERSQSLRGVSPAM